MKRIAFGIMLTLLSVSMLMFAFNAQPVKASGAIYIRADGSVDPPRANVTSGDLRLSAYAVDGTHIVKVRDYPIANFTWSPDYPTATETVLFDASASMANNGNITIYIWDFDDESPILCTPYFTVKHVYLNAQNYSVCLTVMNSEGLSSSITKTLTVLKAPPKPSFNFLPEVPIADQPVTFNASGSYDPDGSIVSCTWDFGDGNMTNTVNFTVTHVYSIAGNYTVTLNVTDNDGLTASTSRIIKIITYPTADFVWQPSAPESSKPVTFDASMSTANSGVIITYTWDFGDSNMTSVTDPLIAHVYAVHGNYTVALTVLNSEGLSTNIIHVLPVAGCAPEAIFDWQPLYPVLNETVIFDASNSNPNGGVIAVYEWNFGDGSAPQIVYFEASVTHEYSSFGEYNVTLKVTDTESLDATTFEIIVVVAEYGPIANFTWSPTTPMINMTVTFDASSCIPGRSEQTIDYAPIIEYEWNFSGVIIPTGDSTILYIFMEPGNFTVTLTVTDSVGRTDSTSDVVEVLNQTRRIYDIVEPYGQIDIKDISTVAKAFGSTPGSPRWNPVADITGTEYGVPDGKVDIKDISLVARHFGEEY